MKQHRSTRGRGVSSVSGGSGLGEDVNPSAYIVNLADCMLVFACGLMMSLVAYWNLDLPSMSEVEQNGEMEHIDDVNEITDPESSSGSSYVPMGQVYKDAETGQLYMLVEDGSEGGES